MHKKLRITHSKYLIVKDTEEVKEFNKLRNELTSFLIEELEEIDKKHKENAIGKQKHSKQQYETKPSIR